MDKLQLSHLLQIQKASKQNRLVLFVGAGVSVNSGVPAWSGLINEMKDELGLKYETDDLKIAQLYKEAKGNIVYLQKVKNVLKHNQVIPNDIHELLLELNPCHIITTNYDNLIEKEIEKQRKQFAIIREDKDLPNISYPNTLIKMHGDFDIGNIVLTENDYYSYKDTFPLIRAYVLSLFASKTIVFVGFSFADLNLKMILHELHSILNDSMPRAFLVSDVKPEAITYDYYKNKGINIVHIENSDFEEIAPLSSFTTDLTIPKGIYLYKVLRSIQWAMPNLNSDIVSVIYSNLLSCQEEIRNVDDGIKYLLPKEERAYWHLYSDGVQISSPYFKKLEHQLKTFTGRRKFIIDHPELDLKRIKIMAYYHSINEIDEIKILSSNFYTNIDRYTERQSVLTTFYNFDFPKLNAQLKDLNSKVLSLDADDLEYPFILCKLGRYFEAYQIFDKISREAWNIQKQILYFICLYNIKSIYGGLYNQLWNRTDIDISAISKRIEDINLDETLDRLSLPPFIKLKFHDLLTFKTLGDRVMQIDELKEKLHQQRKLSERGGVSINSNIDLIISKYEREFLFCHFNYILSDEHQQFKALSRDTIIGVLNSLVTPDRSFEGLELHGSKLDELNELCLIICVFNIETKQLKAIFKQYEIDTITFDDGAIEKINLQLENLAKSTYIPFEGIHQLNGYVSNLLFLISKSKIAGLNVKNLYTVFCKFSSSLLTFIENKMLLFPLLETYHADEEQIKNLIDLCLRWINDERQLTNLFSYLSYQLKKVGNSYSYTKPLTIESTHKAEQVFPLYDVIPEENRALFQEQCQNKIRKPVLFWGFINSYSLPVIFEEKFIDFLNSLSEKTEDYERCCKHLADIRQKDIYTTFHSAIDSAISKHDCIKFFLAPDSYDKNNATWSWFKLLDKTMKEKLAKKEPYRSIIKEKLKEGISNDIKKNLIDLL